MSVDFAKLFGGHLEATRALRRYNDHVFALISRRIPPGAKTLEIGPGLGDFTERFQRAGTAIDCVEPDPVFREASARFCRKVVPRLADLPGTYDAITSVNVLEHVDDDVGMLRELHAKLAPDGLVALYLPAHQYLFSHLDKLVEHYRRYDPPELVSKVRDAGFTIEETAMVDSIGLVLCGLYKYLHWGDGNLYRGAMRFYDTIAWPISRTLDVLLRRRVGKSVFVLGRKGGGAP